MSDNIPTTPLPPLFKPGGDYEDWKFRMELYLMGRPETEKTSVLLSFLDENALKIFSSSGTTLSSPASEIWEVLDHLFLPIELPEIFRQQLDNREQWPGESVDEFAQDLRLLAYKAFPQKSYAQREAHIFHCFTSRIYNQELRAKFLRKTPESFGAALDRARRYEAVDRFEKLSVSDQSPTCRVLHQLTAKTISTQTNPPKPWQRNNDHRRPRTPPQSRRTVPFKAKYHYAFFEMSAHLLPCKIDADGMYVDAASVFTQSDLDGQSYTENPVLKAHIRGRPIVGTKLALPETFAAALVSTNGHLEEDSEPLRLSVNTTIHDIVLWNLSSRPVASDKIPTALLWLQLAKIVHTDE